MNTSNATFTCHQKLPRPQNTEYRLSLISSEGRSWLQGTFSMLIIQVQRPIYKFIYPESEPVLLAGDTSERQSLTRTITHYIKFYILLVLYKTLKRYPPTNKMCSWAVLNLLTAVV